MGHAIAKVTRSYLINARAEPSLGAKSPVFSLALYGTAEEAAERVVFGLERCLTG
jgi:hypothetical protein